jgi:hypothetical protein
MSANQEKCDERAGLPSASNWRRYELCAGSYQLAKEARRLEQEAHTENEAAARGTRIHAFLTGVPDEDGHEITLSPSEAQSADFLQDRATGEVQRIFGTEPVKQLQEQRLWMILKGQRILSGQFDRVIYTEEVALCQDFKTGFSEPDPAEQNAQLKVLAVLVALHLPETIREVIVQIISGPYGVTEARYSLEALGIAYGEIRATLAKINAADAPLVPGPDQCRYCPAINICQAARDLVRPMTELRISALPDGTRAAQLLDEITVLRNLFDSIEEFYREKLLNDPTYDLPNYAMVPGSIRREVTSWDEAHARLSEYLEGAELWGAANYRLGDIERSLAKKLKLKGPALKQKLAEILHGLIEEKQNASSLKRVKGEPKLVSLELP